MSSLCAEYCSALCIYCLLYFPTTAWNREFDPRPRGDETGAKRGWVILEQGCEPEGRSVPWVFLLCHTWMCWPVILSNMAVRLVLRRFLSFLPLCNKHSASDLKMQLIEFRSWVAICLQWERTYMKQKNERWITSHIFPPRSIDLECLQIPTFAYFLLFYWVCGTPFGKMNWESAGTWRKR